MGNIQLLDSETINKIAAGEVVERPSSIVKELVENAIDAGASAVTVEIADGGISLIRITDNGSGIMKEDIQTAFLRHSTSKIRSAKDLSSIMSLGFRGEALSSISAVSMLELLTKTSGSMTGTRYCIDGGIEKAFEEIGCPDGTTFIVRQIFYNTPARKKFLKTPATEAGYVGDLMSRLAMSHPDVSFKFINNRQTKLQTSGNGRLKDILYHIYGREIANSLILVNAEISGIKMYGFIGKPNISRGNRSYENYFINGRYIKSAIITQAIEDAFKTYTMVHKFPFAALHFEVDTQLLDVNVHPTKMQVRISNGPAFYDFVYHALKDTLAGKELILGVVSKDLPKPVLPKADEPKSEQTPKYDTSERLQRPVREQPLEKPQPIMSIKPPDAEANRAQVKEAHVSYEKDAVHKEVIHKETGDFLPVTEKPAQAAEIPIQQIKKEKPMKAASVKTPEPFEKNAYRDYTAESSKETEKIITGEQMGLFDTGLLTKEAKSRHKIIGQIFDTYWIIEYEQKMFIIDQHAAHEKVMYERLMKRFMENIPLSQLLDPPLILSLTMAEIDLLEASMDYFTKMGFVFEAFGGKEYALRAVPQDLYGYTEKDMVMELLDQLSNNSRRQRVDVIADQIATMACKAAVKGNMHLSYQEADALIDELLKLENPYTCPHGRPTVIMMSKYELEKRFKRIV